jgi:hypothetical protein
MIGEANKRFFIKMPRAMMLMIQFSIFCILPGALVAQYADPTLGLYIMLFMMGVGIFILLSPSDEYT